MTINAHHSPEHFHTEHFPCREQACLDHKFVVFGSEQELRQHMAREHSENMTKWERRQAMTLTPDIQVSLGWLVG